MRIIVRGARGLDDVKAAAAVGADGVTFVVESKEHPRNLDITEVTEAARGAPLLLSVIVDVSSPEEARLRRTIGSAHPHAVVVPHDLDPMILADLQVGFPEVKWMARLKPSQYEPFLDAADALVFSAADAEDAASVRDVTRTRVVVEDVTEENVADVVKRVRPFAVMVDAADAESVARVIRNARGASQ